MIGRVRWFDHNKGYGFIDSDNKEIYVHFKAIKMHGYRTLQDNQLVDFKLVCTNKGYHANNVIIIKDEIDV